MQLLSLGDHDLISVSLLSFNSNLSCTPREAKILINNCTLFNIFLSCFITVVVPFLLQVISFKGPRSTAARSGSCSRGQHLLQPYHICRDRGCPWSTGFILKNKKQDHIFVSVLSLSLKWSLTCAQLQSSDLRYQQKREARAAFLQSKAPVQLDYITGWFFSFHYFDNELLLNHYILISDSTRCRFYWPPAARLKFSSKFLLRK